MGNEWCKVWGAFMGYGLILTNASKTNKQSSRQAPTPLDISVIARERERECESKQRERSSSIARRKKTREDLEGKEASFGVLA